MLEVIPQGEIADRSGLPSIVYPHPYCSMEQGILKVYFYKYDIVPAKKLGYTTVWVNRQGLGRPGRVKETFLVGDLRARAYVIYVGINDLVSHSTSAGVYSRAA